MRMHKLYFFAPLFAAPVAAASAGGAAGAATAAGISASTIATIAAATTAASSLAATGISLANKPKMPEMGVPKPDDPTKAAYAEAQALMKRKGSQSTILTGPMGLQNQPQTQRSTLGA